MTLVAKMYAAHGMLKPAEVVTELAAETLDRRYCQPCAESVLETARGGKEPLKVQTFRDAYNRLQEQTTEHGFHIGQSDHETDVGKAEGRWRTEDVDALVAAGMNPDRAQVAAAMRWANKACGIGEDLDIEAWTRHTPRNIYPATIEAAWNYGRACNLKEPVEMSDAEWDAAVQSWEKAWLEAMA